MRLVIYRDRVLTLISRFLGNEKVMDYGLLLVFSILPFLWYGSDLILSGYFADMIDPLDAFIRCLYSWDSRTYLGYPYLRSSANLFPLHSFSIVFSAIGTLISSKDSLLIANRLWLILFFFLPAISMHYLMGVLTPKPNRIGRLMASFAYMYALPNVLHIHSVGHDVMLAYGTLPMMLGFFIRGMSTLNYIKYGSLLGLASLLMGSLSPPLVAINLLVLVAYFFYDLITDRTHILQKIKFTIFALLLFILLNAHVIISWLDYMMHAYLSPYTLSETVQFMSTTTSYLETFRLLGHWGFYTGYKGVPYFSFAPQYVAFESPANPVLIFTTLLIPIVVSIALIVRPRNRYALFFGILIVLTMPMATGTNPSNPTGAVILWLHENISWFWIFRNVNRFLTPLSLAFSVLIGFIVNKLSQAKEKKGKIMHPRVITVFLIACLILVNSWPVYTGNLFENNIRAKKIPEYWYKAADWLNSQPEDFRVFSLPEQYFAVYDWGMPFRDISTTLFKSKSQILMEPGGGYAPYTINLTRLAYKLVAESTTESVLSKVLGLMNVKFIIQRNDVDWAFYNVDPPERVRSILTSQEGIHLERQFGQLDFYRNEYVVPYIYAVTSLSYVEGGLEFLPQLASSDTIDFKSSAMFFSDIQPEKGDMVLPLATYVLQVVDIRLDNKSLRNNQESIYPKYTRARSQNLSLTYTRHNPTLYKVRVNTHQPFVLVFSEAYDERWAAFIREKPLEKHFLVNAYANGWYVDETGDFTITLRYRPQHSRNVGYAISTITLAVVITATLGPTFGKWLTKQKSKPR